MKKKYLRNKIPFRSIAAVISAAALVSSGIAGCGTAGTASAASSSAASSAASSASSAAGSGSTASESSNVKYGQVTAISGSTVTLNMGTMSSGGGQGGMGGPGGDQSGSTSGSSSGNTPPSMPSGTQSGSSSGNTPPSMPSGTQSGSSSGNTPPSMPSGTQSGSSSGNTPPSMPSGDQSGSASGNGGQAPSGMGGSFTADGTTATVTISDTSIISVESMGTSSAGSLSDIAVDSILKLEYDSDGKTLRSITVMQTQGGGQGGAPGGNAAGTSSSESAELTGATTVDGETQTLDSQTLSSSGADENVLLVTGGGTASVTNSTLNKTGDSSSADNSNFTGLNAILCAQAGSTVKISDSTLTSASEGSNAIFATGNGAKVTASGITINTTGDSSRGLDATYGGTINASDVKITTSGAHCAPVATDRGGGTVTVDKGTLSASGDGSPCIYSTGDITVSNVTGTATGSQCLCVEGKNSVTIKKCDLTGAGLNGIMLYQSTSGDADEGTAVLTAEDCSLTTTSDGPMFYITNTQAEIDLSNTVLNFGSGILVNCAGNNTNNWGTEGSNGGTLTLNASSQTLKGDIDCDSISSVSLALSASSKLEGAADHADTGDCSVTLDSTSTWTLTGDSYVSALTDSDTGCANIISGGHTLYYDSSNSANSWLNGQTISLSGGGSIAPMA